MCPQGPYTPHIHIYMAGRTDHRTHTWTNSLILLTSLAEQNVCPLVRTVNIHIHTRWILPAAQLRHSSQPSGWPWIPDSTVADAWTVDGPAGYYLGSPSCHCLSVLLSGCADKLLRHNLTYFSFLLESQREVARTNGWYHFSEITFITKERNNNLRSCEHFS